MIVKIPDLKKEILDGVQIRLNYLYPNLEFKFSENEVEVNGLIDDKNNLKAEISYLLYREKIYIESIDVRKKIYESF
jgi:hypothetical protein